MHTSRIRVIVAAALLAVTGCGDSGPSRQDLCAAAKVRDATGEGSAAMVAKYCDD